ncbi:hypothetical protein N752_18385 [Desulforamulus aquiferis]|nr:hypothetical protein N752_18385 [Desulforamulus aquiferis]
MESVFLIGVSSGSFSICPAASTRVILYSLAASLAAGVMMVPAQYLMMPSRVQPSP